MSVELIKPREEHLPEIARILFDAFRNVAAAHNHPTDFPVRDLAVTVAGMLFKRPDFVGVVAVEGGKVLGSNFAMVGDEVAGVGPLTVDPAAQSKGVGRILMEWMIDESKRRGFSRIRLIQEAFNRTSLALYSRLGYVVRDPLAELIMPPGAKRDDSVRVAAVADGPVMDTLYKKLAGLSRKVEIQLAIEGGFPVVMRQRAGRVTGYLISTIFGHGIAETNADMLALIEQLGNLNPEGNHFILPLRNGELFKMTLDLGLRVQKVMNLMSIGEYQEPNGCWLPSVAY